MKVTGYRYEMQAYHLNSGGVDIQKQKQMREDKPKPSACVSVSISDEAKRLYQMAIQCAAEKESD